MLYKARNIQSNESVSRRGSILATVVIFTAVVALAVASILRLTLTETKLYYHSALRIEARNAAESVAEYVSSEIIRRAESGVLITPTLFTASPIELSDAVKVEMFTGTNVNLDSLDYKLSFKDHGGQWYFISDKDPMYAGDPLAGQYIWARTIEVSATAKAVRAGEESQAYVTYDFFLRDSPLLSYTIFYNMDAEFFPWRHMEIDGPIHINGDLYTGPNKNLKFQGKSTVAGDFYMERDVSSVGKKFRGNTFFSEISTKDGGVFHDSRTDEWGNYAKQRYRDALLTGDHGVDRLNPVATSEFIPDDPTTAGNEYSNDGYSIIEPILPKELADGSDNPDFKGDAVRQNKIAYEAGLLLRVEYNTQYTPGTDPKNELYVVKGYKYDRADAFSAPKETASGDLKLVEVQLPEGLIGNANADLSANENPESSHPESYSYNSESGLITGGMFDNRQNVGMDVFTLDMSVLTNATSGNGSGSKASFNNYNLDKDWNGVVYFELPTSRKINSDGSFEKGNSGGRADGVVKPVSLTSSNGKDASIDMALQVINAGQLPTRRVHGESGFTLATNAPVYTVGHFNADGIVNSHSSSSPDSRITEVPSAIVADTYNVLSENWKDGRAYGAVYKYTNDRKAVATEVSAAVIAGSSPKRMISNNKWEAGQGSAGVQNFLRRLEGWNGNKLAYRGSMVALFHSEAHPKRQFKFYNSAPERFWGYHDFFRESRFPPGLPLARSYRRVNFKMINETEYKAL